MRRLVVQGMLWALNREATIPADGLPCVPPSGWHPTNAGFGGQRRGRTPPAAIAEPDRPTPDHPETRTSD
jgi:hypothetical protein